MDLRIALDRLTAGLGLAVFAVAFRSWWSVRARSASWAGGHETNVVFTTDGRTAWQASTRWTIAVLLAAAVAVVWLVLLLWRRGLNVMATAPAERDLRGMTRRSPDCSAAWAQLPPPVTVG